MKRYVQAAILAATASTLVLPCAVSAAGLDELNRFAGTWDSPGAFVDGPYSKAGSAKATTICAWSSDRIFMICQQQVTTATKTEHDLGIYSYDDAAKAYRFYAVRQAAVNEVPMTLDGDTIAYSNSFDDGGKHVTIRTLNTWEGADRYRWRSEYSTDGGATGTLMGSGTATRR